MLLLLLIILILMIRTITMLIIILILIVILMIMMMIIRIILIMVMMMMMIITIMYLRLSEAVRISWSCAVTCSVRVRRKDPCKGFSNSQNSNSQNIRYYYFNNINRFQNNKQVSEIRKLLFQQRTLQQFTENVA